MSSRPDKVAGALRANWLLRKGGRIRQHRVYVLGRRRVSPSTWWAHHAPLPRPALPAARAARPRHLPWRCARADRTPARPVHLTVGGVARLSGAAPAVSTPLLAVATRPQRHRARLPHVPVGGAAWHRRHLCRRMYLLVCCGVVVWLWGCPFRGVSPPVCRDCCAGLCGGRCRRACLVLCGGRTAVSAAALPRLR